MYETHLIHLVIMFRSSDKCVRLYLFLRWIFLICYYLLVLRWRCCTELVTEYVPIIIIIITEKVNSFLGFGFF